MLEAGLNHFLFNKNLNANNDELGRMDNEADRKCRH